MLNELHCQCDEQYPISIAHISLVLGSQYKPHDLIHIMATDIHMVYGNH